MPLLTNGAPSIRPVSGTLFLAALAWTSAAVAQTTATVSVNAGSPLTVIPNGSFGVNTAVWDGDLLDSDVPTLLSTAGLTALRYPGGSTADMYNWQANSIVPGQSSFANSSNTFDAFMGLSESVGATPIITVNYGSNTDGNGGGTPAFAASWVQYANVTKSYRVKYWEIGNEVYGNGEYGSAWETDLHSAHDPTTYGENVAAFASAMKAVDPTILVGAVLTAPGNWPDGQSPDWNTNVLAQCGSDIDFVIVHWYPQNPGSESDSALLDAPESGSSESPGITSMVSTLKSLIAQYAGSNAANVQILVTETNSVSSDPGKQTVSIVNALFVADDVVTWLENGVTSVDVWALHDGSTSGNTSSSLAGSASFGDYGILSNASSGEPSVDTPFPTYYGLEMLTNLGQAGDTLVSASSSNSLLASHAVARADGDLAVLLINKDPSNTTTATVSVSGYTPAESGTLSSYGASSSALSSTTITNIASSFAIALPPYSMTTVLLTPASASSTSSSGSSPSTSALTPSSGSPVTTSSSSGTSSGSGTGTSTAATAPASTGTTTTASGTGTGTTTTTTSPAGTGTTTTASGSGTGTTTTSPASTGTTTTASGSGTGASTTTTSPASTGTTTSAPSTTAPSSSTTTTAAAGAGPATFAGNASSNSPWFDEDDVVLNTSAPITALTLTITVPATNVTYNGAYDTIGSQIVASHTSGTNIVYTFTLTSGQTIGAGSFTFAGQLNGNGTAHPASGDSWSVSYVSGGTTYTQSGAI